MTHACSYRIRTYRYSSSQVLIVFRSDHFNFVVQSFAVPIRAAQQFYWCYYFTAKVIDRTVTRTVKVDVRIQERRRQRSCAGEVVCARTDNIRMALRRNFFRVEKNQSLHVRSCVRNMPVRILTEVTTLSWSITDVIYGWPQWWSVTTWSRPIFTRSSTSARVSTNTYHHWPRSVHSSSLFRGYLTVTSSTSVLPPFYWSPNELYTSFRAMPAWSLWPFLFLSFLLLLFICLASTRFFLPASDRSPSSSSKQPPPPSVDSTIVSRRNEYFSH